jgi:hypothetical protein
MKNHNGAEQTGDTITRTYQLEPEQGMPSAQSFLIKYKAVQLDVVKNKVKEWPNLPAFC